VLAGLAPHTVVVVRSTADAATWRERLQVAGPIVVVRDPGTPEAGRTAAVACAGATARAVGVLARAELERAVHDEVAELGPDAVAASTDAALAAFDAAAAHAGCAREGAISDAAALARPAWIDLPLEPAGLSAPDVFAAGTSVAVRTGLWRTLRPVLDPTLCRGCTWVCGTACPDSAIHRSGAGRPAIDYDYCKGCLVCVAVCPSHAIHAVLERDAERAAEPPR